MSTKKKTGSRKEPAAAVGSKSQLLLALKDQVVQLQQQLQAEQEEREKISSWLANTLKPNLKSKFGEYREEIDGHSNQIERILQYLKDNRGANSGEQSVSREEFEELKRELAIERESRVQLNIWLKKSFGKNLELLDARISEKSNGSAGTPTTMTKSSTTSVLPESVPEWLRMIGYERYIGEFQRAKCNDVKKLVRLTDDHLVKLGIALKRHRDDILYSVDELKEKLEAPTPKTPSTPIVRDILSDSDVDPFSESEIEAKVSEQQAEKDKLIEMEKRRMQQQFEEEKRLWMEKERERIREEVERTERERMRQEEEKLTKKLAKERKLIEEQQKEIAQKELETKKLLQQQRDEEKKTREAEKRLRLEMERKERLETERKERERKEQEEWSRREREDRDRNEQKNAKHTEPEEDTLSEPKETETPAPEKVVEKTEVKATTVDKRASGGAKKQTATTEDPETGKSFKELLDEVRDDTCKTNWVAFYFDKASNSIKLTNYGSGGHEDLMNHLDDDKVQYAMLRVVDPKRRVKFIYIHWVGQKAHAFLKARSGTKKAEMLELMGQFHIEMPAETKDDVSKQAILTKLKAAVNF